MQSANSPAVMSAFLLGVTFLVFSIARPNGLEGSQLDEFRTGVALDVASFIFFLIATCSSISYSWIVNGMELRHRLPGKVISWVLLVLQSAITIPAFFMGLVTLVVSVIGFVQAILGSTADDGDNLAIVSVSFLTLAGSGVLCILAVATLFRVLIHFDFFTRDE